MRTTIRIEDLLFRQLKEKAARTGRTISDLVEDAVRASMNRAQPPPMRLEPLPVFGGSGVMPGVDLESSATLLDVMDEETELDAVRGFTPSSPADSDPRHR